MAEHINDQNPHQEYDDIASQAIAQDDVDVKLEANESAETMTAQDLDPFLPMVTKIVLGLSLKSNSKSLRFLNLPIFI